MKKLFLTIFTMLITGSVVFCQERTQHYQAGDFRFNFKLPHFNTLSFNVNKTFRDVEYGFNGYDAGLEYSYRDKKFIEMSCAYVMTFEWFIPAPVDAEYNKIMMSGYFNITDNVVLGSFTIGYGLHYSVNTWKEWTRNLDTVNRQPLREQSFTHNNLGLTLNAYFRAGRTLHFGIIYQPSFLNLNQGAEFIYEHSISAGVNWRFKLLNTKMQRQRLRRM